VNPNNKMASAVAALPLHAERHIKKAKVIPWGTTSMDLDSKNVSMQWNVGACGIHALSLRSKTKIQLKDVNSFSLSIGSRSALVLLMYTIISLAIGGYVTFLTPAGSNPRTKGMTTAFVVWCIMFIVWRLNRECTITVDGTHTPDVWMYCPVEVDQAPATMTTITYAMYEAAGLIFDASIPNENPDKQYVAKWGMNKFDCIVVPRGKEELLLGERHLTVKKITSWWGIKAIEGTTFETTLLQNIRWVRFAATKRDFSDLFWTMAITWSFMGMFYAMITQDCSITDHQCHKKEDESNAGAILAVVFGIINLLLVIRWILNTRCSVMFGIKGGRTLEARVPAAKQAEILHAIQQRMVGYIPSGVPLRRFMGADAGACMFAPQGQLEITRDIVRVRSTAGGCCKQTCGVVCNDAVNHYHAFLKDISFVRAESGASVGTLLAYWFVCGFCICFGIYLGKNKTMLIIFPILAFGLTLMWYFGRKNVLAIGVYPRCQDRRSSMSTLSGTGFTVRFTASDADLAGIVDAVEMQRVAAQKSWAAIRRGGVPQEPEAAISADPALIEGGGTSAVPAPAAMPQAAPQAMPMPMAMGADGTLQPAPYAYGQGYAAPVPVGAAPSAVPVGYGGKL
jgi:hypothetical protein